MAGIERDSERPPGAVGNVDALRGVTDSKEVNRGTVAEATAAGVSRLAECLAEIRSHPGQCRRDPMIMSDLAPGPPIGAQSPSRRDQISLWISPRCRVSPRSKGVWICLVVHRRLGCMSRHAAHALKTPQCDSDARRRGMYLEACVSR
jgi:hypothetical protein